MDRHFTIIDTFIREACNETGIISEKMTALVSLAIIKKYIDELRQEIAIDNSLIEERNSLLAAIPACPIHGETCIPHARAWIENVKEWIN
jgi:hypothetical protein